jgi:hypothetical protein
LAITRFRECGSPRIEMRRSIPIGGSIRPYMAAATRQINEIVS